MKTAPIKIDSLQAIRAFAAVFVMLFHGAGIIKLKLGYLFLNDIFCVGFSGVIIFFVLSGFIIYYTSYGKKYSPVDFLKKRFIRIYPAYWLFIALSLTAYMIGPRLGNSPKGNVVVVIKSILLYPQEKPLLPLSWTLTYEIIFYIFFAYSFLKKPAYLWLVFFCWVAAILLVNFAGIKSGYFAVDIMTRPIVINFELGCAVAYFFLEYRYVKYYRLFIYGGLIYFLISWVVYYQNRGKHFEQGLPGQFAHIYMFGIPAAIFMFGILYSKVSINKILVLVGDASYSLYLLHIISIHWLIVFIVKLGLGNYFANLAGSLFIYMATVAIACLFYLLIEKPILAALRRFINGRNSQAAALNKIE